MVLFDRPSTIFYETSIPLLISKNLKRSRDPEHVSFGGNLSFMHYIIHLCINQLTMFEVPSFNEYKDMIGVKM